MLKNLYLEGVNIVFVVCYCDSLVLVEGLGLEFPFVSSSDAFAKNDYGGL